MPDFSPAFWKWFGASRVVDAHGQPLVVYHGTEAGEFSSFYIPAFFTESRAEAEGYATETDVDEMLDIRYVRPEDAPAIPAKFDPFDDYLPIMGDVTVPHKVFVEDGTHRLFFWNGKYNPVGDPQIRIISGLMADRNGNVIERPTKDDEYSHPEEVAARQKVYAVYLSIQNPLHLRWEESNILGKRLGAKGAAKKIQRWIAQGYDGIYTVSDTAAFFAQKVVGQWIPFFPEQIKAVDNDGTWDSDDPDIRSNPGLMPEAKLIVDVDAAKKHMERIAAEEGWPALGPDSPWDRCSVVAEYVANFLRLERDWNAMVANSTGHMFVLIPEDVEHPSPNDIIVDLWSSARDAKLEPKIFRAGDVADNPTYWYDMRTDVLEGRELPWWESAHA